MPFVPAANTATVEIIYSIDNQFVENTLAFSNSFGWTGTTIASLATAMMNWAVTQYLPLASDALLLLRVEARDISTQNSFVSTAVAPLDSNGGYAVEAMSTNVAPCISFRTGVAGRSFRGRNYLPGLPISHVTLNTLNTDWANGALDAYGAINATVNPFGGTHVILSRFSGVDANGNPIPRATGVTTPVTAYQFTDLIVDSQRRRLPRRGS